MSQAKPLTAQALAQILHEELERDHWGEIDPGWLFAVAQNLSGEDAGNEEDQEAVRSLREALGRAAARINQGRT